MLKIPLLLCKGDKNGSFCATSYFFYIYVVLLFLSLLSRPPSLHLVDSLIFMASSSLLLQASSLIWLPLALVFHELGFLYESLSNRFWSVYFLLIHFLCYWFEIMFVFISVPLMLWSILYPHPFTIRRMVSVALYIMIEEHIFIINVLFMHCIFVYEPMKCLYRVNAMKNL